MKTQFLDGVPEEIVMERDTAAPRAVAHRAMRRGYDNLATLLEAS